MVFNLSFAPFFTLLDWRQPLWLLLAFQPFILWLVLFLKAKKSQQNFADSHLLPWLKVHDEKTVWQKILSRNTAYVLAWILFALALAGPRVPDPAAKKSNDVVLDVMLVVDVSRSMKATDIKPSRLRRATLEIFEFLSLAKNLRVGITVYAARPHLFVPLTSDFKALQFYLESLDTLQLPTLGSDAGAALEFSQKELMHTKQTQKQAILWITDGGAVDKESGNFKATKKALLHAKSTNIPTYILGLGTQEGGAIPLANGSWLESEGQGVISRMDVKLLQKLSELVGGFFSVVSNDESDWNHLYKQGLKKLGSAPNKDNDPQWIELFAWALFPAILFLLMALLPFNLRSFISQRNISSINVLLAIVIMLFVFNDSSVYAKSAEEKIYKKNIQTGIEAYKNKQYARSKGQFIQSVLRAKSNNERGVALHNLGNALFQSGDYKSATEVFTDALRYLPEQVETMNNQKLSFDLHTILENRRRKSSTQGNFSTPNDDSTLFDLPDIMPFMLESKAVNLLKASLPDMPADELNKLLDKGMQQFQLEEGDETLKAEKREQQQELAQARIHFMGLEEQSSNQLWKRLFEIEEGFPAAVKKPKVIPGVQPW